MPNIAFVLKNELSRVARKEARNEALGLKKVVATYRKEIAALKRRTHALEQQLRHVGKTAAKAVQPLETEASSGARRFSAKGLASQRQRLEISAADCGLLLGASSQSIYNWEDGKTRPLARHLPAIVALRTLGKRSATALIESRRAGA